MYQGINPDTLASPNEDRMYLQSRPVSSIYCPFDYTVSEVLRVGTTITLINVLFDYIWRANLDAFLFCIQKKLYHHTRIFSEEVKTGQNMGFLMFPTSPGPLSNFYNGRPQAALTFLTRSSRLGKMRPIKKCHPPKKLGQYMQIFTWIVIMLEQHRMSIVVTKGYKLWLFPPLTPSGLLVS